MDKFSWIKLPSGQAHFSGGLRGWDEMGHETFAISHEGRELFGEFQKNWSPDEKSYHIEIVSIGYRDRRDVGLPGARVSIQQGCVQQIQQLISELFHAGVNFQRRPFLLSDPKEYEFLGVTFRDDWILAHP